jgi:WD40 repeat protein
VWDVAAGKETFSLPYSRPPRELSASLRPTAESLLAWSADGGQLAVAGGDGTVTVWDVGAKKAVVKLSGPKAPTFSVAWSRDGRRLAAVGGDGVVTLWDPTARQQVLTLRSPRPAAARAVSLAWSPDGRRLALAVEEVAEGTITVWASAPEAPKPGPGK